MKILSFGSLNIDYVYKVSHFVKKGETLSAEELNVYTGGKGLNQSIALSRAGKDLKKFLKMFLLKRYQWLMEEKEQHKLLLNP